MRPYVIMAAFYSYLERANNIFLKFHIFFLFSFSLSFFFFFIEISVFFFQAPPTNKRCTLKLQNQISAGGAYQRKYDNLSKADKIEKDNKPFLEHCPKFTIITSITLLYYINNLSRNNLSSLKIIYNFLSIKTHFQPSGNHFLSNGNNFLSSRNYF